MVARLVREWDDNRMMSLSRERLCPMDAMLNVAASW